MWPSCIRRSFSSCLSVIAPSTRSSSTIHRYVQCTRPACTGFAGSDWAVSRATEAANPAGECTSSDEWSPKTILVDAGTALVMRREPGGVQADSARDQREHATTIPIRAAYEHGSRYSACLGIPFSRKPLVSGRNRNDPSRDAA